MGTIRQGNPVKKTSGAPRPNEGPKGDGETPSPRELRQYLHRFPQASVLVIGDLILDQYVMGG